MLRPTLARRTASVVIFFLAMATSGLALAADSESRYPETMLDWPDAVASLTQMKTKAETCVRILKAYGDESEIAQGRLSYSQAKSDVDGLISGLIIALYSSGRADSLTELQSRLTAGGAGLSAFCKRGEALIPAEPKERGALTAFLSGPLEPLIKSVSAGIAALYDNHRRDDITERRVIVSQLRAAKWPRFDAVQVAR